MFFCDFGKIACMCIAFVYFTESRLMSEFDFLK